MSGAERDPVERLLALLGLAQRAGKLALGQAAAAASVRRGERPLLLLADDIGPAQRRKTLNLAPVAGVVEDVAGKTRLGRALGRDAVAIVAVADRHFISGIRAILEGRAS